MASVTAGIRDLVKLLGPCSFFGILDCYLQWVAYILHPKYREPKPPNVYRDYPCIIGPLYTVCVTCKYCNRIVTDRQKC